MKLKPFKKKLSTLISHFRKYFFSTTYLPRLTPQGDTHMLRKLFAIPLIFSLFIVETHAVTNNGLKAAFDSLNYALTVEWDQTDKNFYSAQMDKFTAELSKLQDEGMSNQEIVKFAVSQVKDAKVARDMETALNMVQINKMSRQEAQKYVTEVMNKSYMQGASWNGGVAGVVAIVLLIAVAAIVAGKARVGEGCYEVYTCNEYCTGSLCYDDCGYQCVN